MAGLFRPGQHAKEMVTKLNAEIRKIVERPDIKSTRERAWKRSRARGKFDAFLKGQLCCGKS